MRTTQKFSDPLKNGASGQVLSHDGYEWGPATVAGTGDVVGPAGATQYHLIMFDDATGKLIADALIETDGFGTLLLDDNALVIRDGASPTKRIQLEASGITAGNTRVYTGPDVDGTLCLTGATQTLTNKTINASQLVDGSVSYAKIQDVSATDKVLGRSTAGAGEVEEIACTAAGRALLDDADAAAQRTTLGLGTKATQNQSGDIVGFQLESSPPASSSAQETTVAGTSTPAENFRVLAFDQTGPEYWDYKIWLSPKYAGGGLTIILKFGAAVSTNNVRWGAALRRIEDTDDLDTTAHTYDYNDVAADVAVPGTVGQTKNATITFTNGADMDSVAAGEFFWLRIRRTAATSNAAGDAYLYGISVRET